VTAYPLVNQTALFAGDKQPVHRYITLAQQAGPLYRGAMLGEVPPAGGSAANTPPTFLWSKAGATDGSQNPVAILAADADPTNGPITVPAYFDGEFAFERMVVDASWTFAAIDANLQNNQPGIYVRQLGILG
jgi:hypothetical protein